MLIIEGKVVHGKGLGKTVGMPTANLEKIKEEGLPPFGVYASKVTIADTAFLAITNIGTRPSVDEEENVTIETHILDFDQDIYDEVIQVELYQFIRSIQKFSSLQEVKKQVDEDAKFVREYFKEAT